MKKLLFWLINFKKVKINIPDKTNYSQKETLMRYFSFYQEYKT